MKRMLAFAAMFLAAGFATLPLSLASGLASVERLGFAAREAQGSVWSGTFADAQFGSLRLGDLDAGLKPLPLLIGRAELELRSPGDGGASGTLSASGSGFSARNVNLNVAAAAALAPLPIASLMLEDLTVSFDRGACIAAEGRVRARTLAGPLPLPPGFSGTARCERDRLLLPLTSQSGMEQIQLRIGANGQYEATVFVHTLDPALGGALAAAGFSRSGAGYALRTRGKLR